MSQLPTDLPENIFQITTLALGGGRQLTTPAATTYVQKWIATANKVYDGNLAIRVGCAIGADDTIIKAAIAQQIPTDIFAIFSFEGLGGWRDSATGTILAAANNPATPHNVQFHWRVGIVPNANLPMAAQLARRSAAVCAGATIAIWFAPGRGSLSAAAASLRQDPHRPVIAVCKIAPPPLLLPGHWRAITIYASPAWLWTNRTQSKLI